MLYVDYVSIKLKGIGQYHRCVKKNYHLITFLSLILSTKLTETWKDNFLIKCLKGPSHKNHLKPPSIPSPPLGKHTKVLLRSFLGLTLPKQGSPRDKKAERTAFGLDRSRRALLWVSKVAYDIHLGCQTQSISCGWPGCLLMDSETKARFGDKEYPE